MLERRSSMSKDSITVTGGIVNTNESLDNFLGKYSSDFMVMGRQQEFRVMYQDSSPLLVVVHDAHPARAYFASNEQYRALGAFANFVMKTGIKIRQIPEGNLELHADVMAKLFRTAMQNGISVFQEPQDLVSQLEESRVQAQSLAK